MNARQRQGAEDKDDERAKVVLRHVEQQSEKCGDAAETVQDERGIARLGDAGQHHVVDVTAVGLEDGRAAKIATTDGEADLK